ncbi:MAG: hypothetical protein J7K40_10770 [candidate division Zixibacteria bacterium]|nr:hypothetical protein [candidate division Zixibacteria bacterium]
MLGRVFYTWTSMQASWGILKKDKEMLIFPLVSGICCLLIAFGTQTTYADRGSIPFDSRIEIFEPNQRAMIAWNGSEEILLLSTDLRASATTKILEG